MEYIASNTKLKIHQGGWTILFVFGYFLDKINTGAGKVELVRNTINLVNTY